MINFKKPGDYKESEILEMEIEVIERKINSLNKKCLDPDIAEIEYLELVDRYVGAVRKYRTIKMIT